MSGTVAVWVVLGLAIPLLIASVNGKFEYAGQFGDMFGGVNSVFTGVAFVAAMGTVMLQTIEMRENRVRQLEESKQETEQLRIANETLHLQKSMQELEVSESVKRFLVGLNSDISRLRESWIDISFHANEGEKRAALARFESAREDLKLSSFTARLSHREIGTEIALLLDQMLQLTKESFNDAVKRDSRTSVLWRFDFSMTGIRSVCTSDAHLVV